MFDQRLFFVEIRCYERKRKRGEKEGERVESKSRGRTQSLERFNLLKERFDLRAKGFV